VLPALEGAIRHTIHAWGLWSVSDQIAVLTRKYMRNYSAGGSKGPCRPLGGVRGVPAFLPHPAAGGDARERRPE